MDISKHIYDFLMERNTSVVVPELGCFTIVYKPAEIRDGNIFPPVKTVEFDSDDTTDDHVLTSYIAQKENITVDQAAEKIRHFYRHFFINRLPLGRIVVLEKFGTFSLNDFGNMIFVPDANFFKDNYGLDQTYFPGATPPQPQKDEPKPEVMQDTLFDPNDNKRFRENTERRRPVMDKQQQPPEKPNKKAKQAPPPKRQAQMKTGGGSSFWALWVLLGVVVLGAAGYYGYPIVYPMLFPDHTTINTIVDAEREAKPLHSTEAEEDTPNPEVAQTLDDATEKKNALNPDKQQSPSSTTPSQPTTASSQPKTASTSSQPATSTTPSQPATAPSTPKKESQPATVAQTQGSAGQGNFVLIIASLSTQPEAERFGKRIQADGLSYEIITAMVDGRSRYRISVASFDNLAEAQQQANLMKSRPHCAEVWVAKR